MRALAALAALCVAAASFSITVPPPPAPGKLAAHPRMVLTPARIASVKASIASNSPDAANFLALLSTHAAYVLEQPVVPHGKPDATGILMAVRKALDNVLTSAAAHVFRANASDTSFLARAVLEMDSLCVTWPDWNTEQHALDTGEALLATGLAYDWLYHDLSASQRATFLSGIVSRGLVPYRTLMNNKTAFWWRNNTINWNCVCTSGAVIAVGALYNDTGAPPWLWSDILAPLVSTVAPCVGAYHFDSSWEEGPGYWNYASKMNVWLFAGLTSLLGDTAGLAQLPGVSQAGRFPIYSTGANVLTGKGLTYNWADAGEGQEWSPFATWWGLPPFSDGAASYYSRLGTNLLGPTQLRSAAWGGFAEALVFYEGEGSEKDIIALPTAKLFSYINVAALRGPWDAPVGNQTFVSMKGGNSSWNHNHLDLGSWVFDMQGQRLATDLGADSYDLPGYFGPQRWSYYRLNSRGHNVIMFNNESQSEKSFAPIVAFNSTGTPAVMGKITLDGYVVVNLTDAYAASAGVTSYLRGFISVSGTNAVMTVDNFEFAPSAHPANMTWQMHTSTAVAQQTRVSLGVGPGTLAFVDTPTGECNGSFGGFVLNNVSAVLPDPPYDSAEGITRVDVVFSRPGATSGCRHLIIAVGNAPIVDSLQFGYPAVRPISEWATLGPLDYS